MNEIRSENEALKKYNSDQQTRAAQEHKRTRSKDMKEKQRKEYSPREPLRRSNSRSPNNIRADYISSPMKDGGTISIATTHYDQSNNSISPHHNPA